MEFSTCDHRGSYGSKCPFKHHSGCWYNTCHEASLIAANYYDDFCYEWNVPGQPPYSSLTGKLKANLVMIKMLLIHSISIVCKHFSIKDISSKITDCIKYHLIKRIENFK